MATPACFAPLSFSVTYYRNGEWFRVLETYPTRAEADAKRATLERAGYRARLWFTDTLDRYSVPTGTGVSFYGAVQGGR